MSKNFLEKHFGKMLVATIICVALFTENPDVAILAGLGYIIIKY